jgi:hypothetical protein
VTNEDWALNYLMTHRDRFTTTYGFLLLGQASVRKSATADSYAKRCNRDRLPGVSMDERIEMRDDWIFPNIMMRESYTYLCLSRLV